MVLFTNLLGKGLTREIIGMEAPSNRFLLYLKHKRITYLEYSSAIFCKWLKVAVEAGTLARNGIPIGCGTRLQCLLWEDQCSFWHFLLCGKREKFMLLFFSVRSEKKENTQQVKALTNCNILFPSIGCIYGVFPQLQESCDSLHNDLDQHMVPLLSVKGTIKKIYIFHVDTWKSFICMKCGLKQSLKCTILALFFFQTSKFWTGFEPWPLR